MRQVGLQGLGGRAVRCPGLWGRGHPAVNTFLHPPRWQLRSPPSHPRLWGSSFLQQGRAKPHIHSWRTGRLERGAGSSLKTRGASTLGRTAPPFAPFPAWEGGGGVPFPLIPDPSPEMLVRARPSPHPNPICPSPVRRGDRPLSPVERAPKCECAGGDSGSRPWAERTFGSARASLGSTLGAG